MSDADEIRWLVATFGIFGITAEDLLVILGKDAEGSHDT